MKPRTKRCAIYTRKSSEEGLEQGFNSLDAQREACAAYVQSQASEGWLAIATRYDDGGFSGGTMERPALQRLLADISAGNVDVVVVYKIDRLTRALADFARIVEQFDRYDVSFVSVTQAFNTTSSMGRLTLNVLLSFAQFEREVTGERIRDKIAASKAKGMWMGGQVPLGYDLPLAGSRALVVNETEAEIVKTIFSTYLELGSVHALKDWLNERGIRSKRRKTRNGKTVGGHAFSRGALFHLLHNQIYLGMIVHKAKVHPGMHPAIVDPDLFEAVQAQLNHNARRHAARRDRVARAPLTGRIFDADGQPMCPTFSYGKGGKLYRYYVSAPLQQGQRQHDGDEAIHRVSAPAFEALLARTVRRVTKPQVSDPLHLLTRIEIYSQSLEFLMPVQHLLTARSRIQEGETAERDPIDRTQLRLTLPIRAVLRGGRTMLIEAEAPGPRPDPVLIRALRAAHEMVEKDDSGLPVLDAAPSSPYHRRLVRLAFLAPNVQRAILTGRQAPGLTLEQLTRRRLPLLWSEQSRVFGAEQKGRKRIGAA
jgi:DNA invertase Pin-like site-specific DNA recombinase